MTEHDDLPPPDLSAHALQEEIQRYKTKVSRLRWYVLVLVIALVFGAIAAPVFVSVYVHEAVDASQTEIACALVELNIYQSRRAAQIARRLGIPSDFPDVPIPVECVEAESDEDTGG